MHVQGAGQAFCCEVEQPRQHSIHPWRARVVFLPGDVVPGFPPRDWLTLFIPVQEGGHLGSKGAHFQGFWPALCLRPPVEGVEDLHALPGERAYDPSVRA